MKTNAKHVVTAAIFGWIALAPVATAQTPAGGLRQIDLPSIRVSYADLNVGSEEGMRTLTDRVNGAVRRVCPTIGRASLDDYGAQCRYSARRDAWRQFEHNQERARALRGVETVAIPNGRQSF